MRHDFGGVGHEGQGKQAYLAVLRALARRMSLGSLVLRIWAPLLVGAVLAVTADPAHARFGWLALFLALSFWLFDAYLLRQRRLFSKALERVKDLPESAIDYRLDTSAIDGDEEAWSTALLSRTPLLLYGCLVLAIGVVRGILSCSG